VTSDVVVVGGGLEGCTAALAAAREGASVRLLSLDPDRFRRHDGLIDVLGYDADGSGPVETPLERLPDLPPDHPYSRVGPDAVRDALALFDDATGERYYGGEDGSNALVPTCGGYLKPTGRYPAGLAAGVASRRRPMLLVGFDGMTAFDAGLAGERLDGTLPYGVRDVTVGFPTAVSHPPSVGYADALDGNEVVDGEAVRDSLADTVGQHLDVEPRVGLPAVLGRTDHAEIRAELQSELDARIFEIPVGQPSLPGLRLGSLLHEALSEAGVGVVTGAVREFDASDGRVRSVRVTGDSPSPGEANSGNGEGETSYDAAEFVLATGGLDSAGLAGDRGGVTEAVFGCHVGQPDSRSEWTAGEPLASQPFARLGVSVTDDLRPVSAAGDPEFENLRAAGGVLGGTDSVAGQSRDGVALATGYAAGLRAAKTV